MRVVATAGHVDHGKSTLVRALTGIDPDRWAEEKARGLTIDLGFAWTTLPSSAEVAFVDVPGHVRFIKNMLAGVGAVDACLFVVSAAEGWKPQSEEHLRILDLLETGGGVVAVTKAGTVDADTLELAMLEVSDRVEGTFLAGAPIVAVDAIDGRGMDDLRAALDSLAAGLPGSVDEGRPRLWVDRSFAAKGAGTVVTGTLTGGSVKVGDALTVVPGERDVRVRALQSHQTSLTTAGPGRRLAMNIVGLEHGEVVRGHAVVRSEQWHRTRMFDASLRVLRLDHEVSRRGAYQLHVGAGEHPARLRVLGPDVIAPGATGLVRIHIEAALPLTPGDRFVVRESGRGETVGGGEVLDVAPVVRAGRAAPTRSTERMIAERGWVTVAELYRLTGERLPPTAGEWVVEPRTWVAAQAALRDRVSTAGSGGLDVATLDDRQRLVLATLGNVTVRDGRARAAGDDTGDDTAALARHPYVAALEASPFAPPPPDGVDRPALRRLVAAGLAVERDGVYFAASAVDHAAREVARLLKANPDGITIGHLRDAVGSSRKHLLPLLNHLDATGVTRRRGDVRIAGPRLPRG